MSIEAPLANELEVQCIKDQLNDVRRQLADKTSQLTHQRELNARQHEMHKLSVSTANNAIDTSRNMATDI